MLRETPSLSSSFRFPVVPANSRLSPLPERAVSFEALLQLSQPGGEVSMIADEISASPDSEESTILPSAANDNEAAQARRTNAHILAIARAIGRQIAREELAALTAANDNSSEGSS
jgi:hypothetical protein